MLKSVQSHSSNTYQPRSGQSVFLSQAHPQIARNEPAIALEPTAASTPGGAHLGAHNAARGVETAPPRHAPNDWIGESLAQRRLRQEGPHLQQSAASGAISTHQGQLPPIINPALRDRADALPQQTDILDKSEPGSEAKRPHGGVRQDKARFESARRASPQPAAVTKVTRARLLNKQDVRSTNPIRARERRERVTLWVDPLVKEELERLSAQEGLSISAAGAAFLDKALQADTHLRYSALLTPIIEQAIARQMRGIATRLTWLLVRVAFDTGQTRSLVTNILGRQPGVSQGLLKTILEASGRSAKGNIMRRTPQIATLIEAVEQWMLEDEENTKKKKTYD